MCLIEHRPRFFSRNYCIRPEAALQERFCPFHRRVFCALSARDITPISFLGQARCFSAPPRRGRYCYHFFLTPKRNGNSKKRASRGRSPLIPPIAPDVVVADCAKLAPSKSAALTRSVAPPLKNTNTSFGLCFCNLSLRTCVVAGMPVKLQYTVQPIVTHRI